ncbi:MAG: preprotein translocase subunit SecA [Candidatus Gracilibacteria bacterium]|jgi:preprotein translocase subunit SecA
MSVIQTLNKIFGDPQNKELKRVAKVVEKINAIEVDYQSKLTAEDIPKKTSEFKERIAKGETVEDLLPEAFALLKNACRHLQGASWKIRGYDYTWDMVPFDVQMVGGIVLHEGKIAEMKTGEGKTLVCTLPVYLNALEGKGVHIVTVNDYLAQRDAEWMGGLYRFLGLSVGVVVHGQNRDEKKAAYAADITYGTNNEFGFDYLRDNMAPSLEALVQRPLHYAIVDEVDSILIDEARTPLIISAPAEESTQKYDQYGKLVRLLDENTHFNIDEKQRSVTLTEEGVKKMEELLGIENIYTEKGFEEVHHIEQALRAHAVYKADVDYLVKDGQIMIVDEFTGRLMPGRRFGQGLHQAIEAKEGVEIKRESRTLATITFQNYFRLYKKLAGMAGTAKTEEEEFETIYGLAVYEIPTHRPVTREDKSDAIYKNTASKFRAIARVVKELNEKGQPVLVGTISVEKSESLSKLFKAEGVPHHVLNAKFHEQEAEIISKAGERGAVTIATNMAGRGTDIKLGEGVKELGGLCVIGSERHEARRIDNQLRGRSGRQGDPGLTQFFVSMEDDLMRIFGGDRMSSLMEKLGLPEDTPIENSLISRSIESAQKKVEGHNFDIRKHLVEYDSVINKHRDIIYTRRRKILENEDLKNSILVLIEEEAERIVLKHPGDTKEIFESVSALHRDPKTPLARETLESLGQEGLIEKIKNYLLEEYLEKEKALPSPDILRRAERMISLRTLDMLWMRHIDELKDLRDAVSLSGYGQRNPLIEYQNKAFQLFEELMDSMNQNTVRSLFHVKINVQVVQKPTPMPMVTNDQAIDQNTEESAIATTKKGSIDLDEVGRNDPCPCGSGKKFKKCHGA